MRGADRTLALLERALRDLGADQGWALYLGGAKSLTRFANNTIHQNVTEETGELILAAVLGKRMGVATTSTTLCALAIGHLYFTKDRPSMSSGTSIPRTV